MRLRVPVAVFRSPNLQTVAPPVYCSQRLELGHSKSQMPVQKLDEEPYSGSDRVLPVDYFNLLDLL